MDEKGLNLALSYLTRRPHSELEVRDYLRKKSVSDEKISMIVERLKELKFLDDESFARWWIRQRTEFKPKGKRLIGIELRQKGISLDLLDQIYAHSSPEEVISDKDKAVYLLKKKREKYAGFGRNELYQKAGGLLARRGFDWEIIRRSIDEVFGK